MFRRTRPQNNYLAQGGGDLVHYDRIVRMWWNWQTRYFEVVVPKGVQVQVLSCAPFSRLFVSLTNRGL
jgi:hypothetical protein